VSALAATLYRGLRSPALAVALLLALAVLAAAGTFLSSPGVPMPPGAPSGSPLARLVGLRDTFRSPPFLALLALAAVNVATCTWHRLWPRLRRAQGRDRLLADVLLHGSLLVIIAGGAAKSLFGFVGTQNVYVGEGTETVYDWRAGRDAPLGFELRADELRERYYPIRARVGVQRAATGEKLGMVEVVEGAEGRLPGGEVRLRIAGFDPGAGSIRLTVGTAAGSSDLALATRAGAGATGRAAGYALSLIAYRADLRDVAVRVTVVDPGAVVTGRWLGKNDSLEHRGLSFFLTGWGTDDRGRHFCGIQVARDPGAPLFWAGCALLALAIPWLSWARGRGGGGAA
jgi:hypothetical protein